MKLLVFTTTHPDHIAHGVGLIVNNTLRVLLNSGEHTVDCIVLSDESAICTRIDASQHGFLVPADRVLREYRRRNLGRLEFFRAFAGRSLQDVERDCLMFVQDHSRYYDAVLWFGYGWDTITTRLPEVCACPVFLHVNDSLELAETHRTQSRVRGLRTLMARLRERQVTGCGAAGLIYCSVADAEHVQRRATHGQSPRIIGLMNGIDAEMFTPAPNKTKNARLTLLFTGVMNFGPNVAASMFLIKNVLQEVSTPLHLRIVGRNPAPELVALAQSSRVHDIEVTGMIPNIVEEYQRADLFVAPIWGSTGTKNKVLEALACGLPVLTTTDVTSGFTDPFPPVLACTDSHTFIARLRDIAKCPDVLGELGRAGREYACNLGWEARTARLISAMQPPSRS